MLPNSEINLAMKIVKFVQNAIWHVQLAQQQLTQAQS